MRNMHEKEIRVIKLFKALSNPIRYKILKSLSLKQMTVAELKPIFRKAVSSISQHLRVLKNLDLVTTQSIKYMTY